MIGALLFFLQTAAATPEPVPTQLVVRTPAHTATIPVMATGRLRLIPSDKLAAAMGGTLKRLANGDFQLRVGESVLEFTSDVPFAKADSEAIPLAEAPVMIGKMLYVPFQVVSEVVPHYVTGFTYDPESGEVRAFNTAARKGTPPPSPDQSTAANTTTDADANDDAQPASPMATPSDNDDATSAVVGNRRRLVVVDAGHGGVDNGMHGPLSGGPQIYEKNITLAVAKLVAQDLREAGLKVLMTRTTDTLIGLYDRGKIANANHGDVFVSIHVNATGSRGRDAVRERGFETYFLAEAKTEDAKRVEAMENSAVRFETSVNAAKGDPLRAILTDMAQNEHLRESSELAQIVEDGLGKFHPGPDRGVQQANFAVLRGSFMPAILCEIGFGTNPSEAAYISDADNERIIARSIAKSVITYLNRYERRVNAGSKK